jgi:putative aldouronate transport system substrate-binding protein
VFEEKLGRRNVLRAAGMAAIAGTGAAIAACGSGNDDKRSDSSTDSTMTGGTPTGATATSRTSTGSSASGTGAQKSVLPSYIPRELVKLDLPATDTGAPGGCLAYPASPVQGSTGTPMSGGDLTFLESTSAELPVPLEKNAYWQELNKRLGCNFKPTQLASTDYSSKVATTIASGDLPDLMLLGSTTVPNIGEVLKSEFQDLSQWLSGDAAKDYPNLATIPTVSWRNMVFNNGIYGIPYVVPLCDSMPQVRQDIFDKLGVGAPKLADGQEFLKLCKDLTDSQAQRWAFGDIPAAQTMVEQMVGVPNEWLRDSSGKFTSKYVSDEFKQSLDLVKGMWTSGYFHPDAATGNSNTPLLYLGGKISIRTAAYITWTTNTSQGVLDNPDFKVGGLILPKWDGGGQSAYHESTGSARMTCLKKASPSRIEEVLRVLDWVATPFGSEEYLFVRYGIKGHDYTLDGTDPVPSKTGLSEVQYLYVQNLSRPVIPLYSPGYTDATRAEYAYLVDLMKSTEPMPTVGLISNTDLSQGSSLEKAISQAQTDIILGHKPLSSWDAAVKTWLSKGGDKIGQEYEAAYANSPTK